MTDGRDTVLVVDDDRDNVEILTHMLEEEGYDVLGAYSGAEALKVISAAVKPIKAILLDRKMPGVDGTSLLKGLKASDRFRNVKVIMQTSMGTPKDIVEGIDAGADRYLTKPLHEKVVLSTVRSCIREYDQFDNVSSKSKELTSKVKLLQDFLRILEEQSDNPSPFELMSKIRVNMREVLLIPGDPEITLSGETKPKGINKKDDSFEICYPPFTLVVDRSISDEQQSNVLQMLAIMAKHIQVKAQESANHRLQKRLKSTIDTAGHNTLDLIREIDEAGDEMSKEQILQKMKINLMEILVAAGHDHLHDDLERLKTSVMSGEVEAQDQEGVDDLLARFGL